MNALNSLKSDVRIHPRIRSLYGNITYHQFIKQLPTLKPGSAVNEAVRNEFQFIYLLLVKSYCEYFFLEVAFIRAIKAFELALMWRWQEIHDTKWPDNKSFSALVDWFGTNAYFISPVKDYLSVARLVRTTISSGEESRLIDIYDMKWMSAAIILINGLYMDKEKRRLARSSVLV
jgi:hypothetical protein